MYRIVGIRVRGRERIGERARRLRDGCLVDGELLGTRPGLERRESRLRRLEVRRGSRARRQKRRLIERGERRPLIHLLSDADGDGYDLPRHLEREFRTRTALCRNRRYDGRRILSRRRDRTSRESEADGAGGDDDRTADGDSGFREISQNRRESCAHAYI